MRKTDGNTANIVRAQLLRLAREQGVDFHGILTRYANERVLYRLSKSALVGQFVLKGATLFAIWMDQPHRATRDVDLLGYGEPTLAAITELFLLILATDVADDGVVFDVSTLRVAHIRAEQAYAGIRVTFRATITTIAVRLQFDVGFGDVVTPKALALVLPVLLDMPAPMLSIYPRETVVAEKAEALVRFGLVNSRLKDFYDLAVLTRTFEFSGETLVQALCATFARRGTPLPAALPSGLRPEFYADSEKMRQWRGFVLKSGAATAGSLAETAVCITGFLMPVFAAARASIIN